MSNPEPTLTVEESGEEGLQAALEALAGAAVRAAMMGSPACLLPPPLSPLLPSSLHPATLACFGVLCILDLNSGCFRSMLFYTYAYASCLMFHVSSHAYCLLPMPVPTPVPMPMPTPMPRLRRRQIGRCKHSCSCTCRCRRISVRAYALYV